MDAVILAGGRGTRLQSVVADRQKVFAEVNGRPFVTRLLDQLAEFGAQRVVLSTGHLAERMETELGTSYRNLQIGYAREPQPLGTGGGTRLALEYVSSSPVFVLNGDSYCVADLHALLDFHLENHARATLLLTKLQDTGRFGRVDTGERGNVTCFREKQASVSPGWINAGVYCLEREVLGSLAPGDSASLETEIFPSLIGKGLCAFQGGGAFIDIGTPESFAEAERFFQ